jgi:hypothetical protein
MVRAVLTIALLQAQVLLVVLPRSMFQLCQSCVNTVGSLAAECALFFAVCEAS